MSNGERKNILVLGGTGKTGSAVVERLQARGHDVRVGSRRGTPPFSWEDPQGWDALLDGIERVYIVHPFPAGDEPGAQVAAFARAAVAHGVDRLVLLSAHGWEDAATVAETGVRESGATWTIVRPSWFDQNFEDPSFFMGFRDAIRQGELAIPFGQARYWFIDTGDIADVVVAALLDDGHAGQAYDLTGPRLLGMADIAADLTAALGRPVVYTPVTGAEYRDRALAAGASAEEADMLASMEMPDVDEAPAGGVTRALGRPPRDFADYARDAAARGVWDAAS
ncbi:NAD(P)H-binding protein [Microbacterium sp. X-17]|uniref:NAD(P)H-binding protein n=1 Tax=Microbacterium sp. X-17 TaxID=3144404 RepID=UPI0031F5697A